MDGNCVHGPGVRTLKTYAFLIGTTLLTAHPALAADAANDSAADGTITVVATGSEMPIDQTGQAIAVQTEADIDRQQGPDLTRIISRLPGVNFAQSGGRGSQASLYVRGANPEHVLVLVDGVRLNDIASPKASNDFGSLLSGGIGRVELLRGSNSIVWGSEAIGGVLALTSREINGVEASAEAGSHATFSGNAVAGLAGSHGSISVNGGYDRTDGISAAAAGTEPDGFAQWRIGGRGRYEVVPGLAVVATARYARSRADYDDFGLVDGAFIPVDSPGNYQVTRQTTGRIGLQYRSAPLDLDAGYALSDTRRDNFDRSQPSPYLYGFAGRSERVELFGRWRLPSELALDFGADQERQSLPREGAASPRSRLTSAHALIGWYGAVAQLAAGVRLDDHNEYGSNWSFGANGSVHLPGGLRLRASYGEGFRAPTLFELYDPTYGNVNYQALGASALRPERSRSYDVGLEWGSRDKVFAGITLFRRDTRNLVGFFSCYGVVTPLCDAANTAGFGFGGYYYNAGRTRAEGVEFELALRPSETLSVVANYTYLKTRDRDPDSFYFGNDLPRRPRNTLNLSVDWTSPWAALALGADVRMVSDSFDNAGNTVRLDGYAVADLRASLPLDDRFEVFGRVENLTDEKYQVVAGYNTPGRAAYAGVRVRF